MKQWFKVEIGLHSYGPCLAPGGAPPGTKIGNYCSLAAGIQILRRNHPIDRISQHPFFFNATTGFLDSDNIEIVQDNPLTIGHDVWIGQNVIITAACRYIGDSAIVAAGAILTADVPPFAIVGGVPAKLIRWRLPESLRQAWIRSQWWTRPVWELTDAFDSFTNPYSETTRLDQFRKLL